LAWRESGSQADLHLGDDPRVGNVPLPPRATQPWASCFARPRRWRRRFAQRRSFLQTMAIAVGASRTMLSIANGARARSRHIARHARGSRQCRLRARWMGQDVGCVPFGCVAHATDVAAAHLT
jgi:hypothetical protein